MVVILIMGLMVSLVSVIVQPDERGQLDVETQRLGRLLELVTAQARFSGSTMAWSAESDAYRFMQFSDESGWQVVRDNDSLRPRQLPDGMHISSLLVENTEIHENMRVIFTAYGQTTAFTVVLAFGNASSQVKVSPIGMVSILTATRAQP